MDDRTDDPDSDGLRDDTLLPDGITSCRGREERAEGIDRTALVETAGEDAACDTEWYCVLLESLFLHTGN